MIDNKYLVLCSHSTVHNTFMNVVNLLAKVPYARYLMRGIAFTLKRRHPTPPFLSGH